MNKRTIVWLTVATALAVIGAMIFLGGMTMLNWNFANLSTTKLETNEYKISEEYTDISISTNTADIIIAPSEDEKTAVVCQEEANLKHSVCVKDGKLCIELVDARKWYEHMSIGFTNHKITVYLPQGEYGKLNIDTDTSDTEIRSALTFESVNIKQDTGNVKFSATVTNALNVRTSTGDIHVEGITAGSLELRASTGKISITDVNCTGDVITSVSTGKTLITNLSCASLASSGTTGKAVFKNLIAAGKLSADRDTGDIILDGCDAAEIFIETSTGDISGSLLSPKIFSHSTDTGSVALPDSTSGGLCKLITNTGDIRITIK